MTTLATVDAAVLAGGLGTRIRGVLGDTPKVLAPVDGRPYLAWLLDWLAAAGLRRVVLCLGHLGSRVESWLAAHPRSDLEIVAMVEPAPLGTAGALRFAGPALRSDPVLVLNGDTFVAADLAAFLARHLAAEAAATVLCTEVRDAGRYGKIEVDAAGRIRRFAEKDPQAGAGLISAGIYLIGRRMLDRIREGEMASLERDVFMRAEPGTLAAHAIAGAFIDIGTPESLREAAAVFRAIAACPAGSAA